MNNRSTRRQFIKGLFGTTGSILAGRLLSIFPEMESILAAPAKQFNSLPPQLPRELEIGEFFGGFLLLPDGAPLPDFVVAPLLGIPIVCNVGRDRALSSRDMAISQSFKKVEDLIVSISPLPLYVLDENESGLYLKDIETIKHPTGELFSYSL